MAIDALKAKMVCELLQSQQDGCKSLRQCCDKVGIAPSTFLGWCDQDTAVAEQYARADKIATDLAFEEFQKLNDEEPPQVQGAFGKHVDSGWVNWQKQRLDNKKWAMSKRRPSKYSERSAIEHSGPNGSAINVNVEVEDIRAKLASRLVSRANPQSQSE